MRHIIIAGKENGITLLLLTRKNLLNAVHILEQTMLNNAKEVLANGKKALACVTAATSEYKDGSLPSGKTLANYHR